MKKIYVLFLSLLAPWLLLAQADSQETGRNEVRKTLSEFITALDHLDWERFRTAFADDATVFYPREFPNRAEGRAEIEKQFGRVFEEIKAGRSNPPYMDIQPRGLNIQVLNDVAIATFHLDDRAGFINRRTLVFRRAPSGWKIVHLHASEVAIGAGPATS